MRPGCCDFGSGLEFQRQLSCVRVRDTGRLLDVGKCKNMAGVTLANREAMQMPYTTSFHCGAVVIEMQRHIRKLTQCNCSICRRYGALWAYQQRKAIRVTAAGGVLRSYSWGKRDLEFFHCTKCGCVTHYHHVQQRADGSDMSAVNMRNIEEPALIANLPIRLLDGAGSWRNLKERVEPHLLMSASSSGGAA